MSDLLPFIDALESDLPSAHPMTDALNRDDLALMRHCAAAGVAHKVLELGRDEPTRTRREKS
jgi:hypothetical protein